MTKKKLSLVVVFFVAGITLAVFISTNAVKEAYRSRTIESEVENLKQKAKRIQSENDAMTERIAYFQTPEFQEKIAKEKLNLQKPDENVIVVKPGVDREQKSDSTQEVVIEEELRVSNYQKWWDFFFKY